MKKAKEERVQEWEKILSRLKAMPPEKLSKAALWVLKSEARKEHVDFDMRAVMR